MRWQARWKRDTIYVVYPYQFNLHVLAYWEDLIDRTEAASVAHVLGTYY